jgi:exopolyphosphatase/guanosine-5'-triphosphate,3'-diphosphate pyrophosphatase
VAEPLAIIDIGSNSGRMVVVRVDELGHLDVLETEGTPLRLVHELATDNSLGNGVTRRTVDALRAFSSIARAAGARTILTVATAAVREASDGDDFVQRLRDETGLDIQVISGDDEARYGFLGAVYGLPADHGVLIDIGGGSLQLARFQDRRLIRSWSVSLGALRLSDTFLQSDPPTSSELKRLQEHVRETLRAARVPAFNAGEQFIGTGGTLRNLAKLDRASRDYPIRRLHGYRLSKKDLGDLVRKLAEYSGAQRAKLPGLNASRFDSIVGGASCAHAVLDALGGSELIVSGQGLREGIALARLREALPSPREVRAASVAALSARFASWNTHLAAQRSRAATLLQQALAPELEAALVETLGHAATLLDIGRGIDFYQRHDHTASMVLAADLAGFSHRGLALLAATVKFAEKDSASLKSWTPLLGPSDQPVLARVGALLGLADAVARLAPPDAAAPLHCSQRADQLTLRAPWLDAWAVQAAARRAQHVFAVSIAVDPS